MTGAHADPKPALTPATYAFAERWRPHRAVAARFLWHDYLARRGRRAASIA